MCGDDAAPQCHIPLTCCSMIFVAYQLNEMLNNITLCSSDDTKISLSGTRLVSKLTSLNVTLCYYGIVVIRCALCCDRLKGWMTDWHIQHNFTNPVHLNHFLPHGQRLALCNILAVISQYLNKPFNIR